VLKNVGLSADLQTRLDELRASRQAPGERPGPGAPASGAQPPRRRAAAPGGVEGKASLAELLLGRDPVKAAATLVQLKSDADEPWKRCATWPEGSTRRCSPTRGWWWLSNPRRAR